MTTIPESVTIEGVRFVRAVRAENAEKDLARTRASLNRVHQTYQSELADAEREEREALEKATALAVERDRLLATIERIDAVRRDFYEVRGDWADPEGAAALKAQMERAILGDPPFEPFELPTEAGTIVLAKGSGNRQDYELHRTTKGRWFTPGLRQQWTDAEMLAEFTNHRLIGADE